MEEKEISYIINELGEDRENYFQAITPPIFQTSNFAFQNVHDLRLALKDESSTYLYSRSKNPTVEILEKKIAALEGGEDCLVTNSGVGAIFIAVLANVKAGDHIISVKHPYTWAQNMFEKILPRFGITTTFVDGRDIQNFKHNIRDNTALIYLESPNSWSFYIQDLRAVASLAREHQILTICDNSYASPMYQRPLEFGIDLTVQSATKYLNGHSDVVAGTISGSKNLIDKIFYSEYLNTGIGAPPQNAWLMLRGLRTFPIRMKQISATAIRVMEYLKTVQKIESISFPWDPDFGQYDLVRKQMTGSGGLMSFILKEKNPEKIEGFCEAFRHILIAVSWGGHESLVMPSIATIQRKEFDPENPDHRKIRLFVGLEDANYIIEDLKRSFATLKRQKAYIHQQ